MSSIQKLCLLNACALGRIEEMITKVSAITGCTRGRTNQRSHLSKMQKKRKLAAKAAKQARKRNRK